MKSEGNNIPFTEIKTYEEAYYYNSDPSSRMNYEKYEVKPQEIKKKTKTKVGKTIGEILLDILEGVFEIIFSFLD